ncbi:Hypothetical predicted protein [Olea europaea subsp. europaea]|uniref:Uncharacterized protein n=1 Tax=Olea europaea subsp. europaea TaxID=158383 RepID=A0A8S0P6Y0_OLEEU|nr:Hypothetical predicted protein [Olea europaea subsp. europaea]
MAKIKGGDWRQLSPSHTLSLLPCLSPSKLVTQMVPTMTSIPPPVAPPSAYTFNGPWIRHEKYSSSSNKRRHRRCDSSLIAGNFASRGYCVVDCDGDGTNLIDDDGGIRGDDSYDGGIGEGNQISL